MNMTTTDYQQQAQDFLDRFGIKFRATLSDSKTAPWRDMKAEDALAKSGHHYRVTLSKSRHLIGSGVRLVQRYQLRPYRITFDFFGSIADAEKGEHPTAYDVLACISGDLYCDGSFLDWCADMGHDRDSIKALQTYRRCKAFSVRLNAFFTSEEIEVLREIR